MREIAKKEERELVALQSSFQEALTSVTLDRFKAELQETAQCKLAAITILLVYCCLRVYD